MQTAIDPALYRQVLGHFPTGVTVITAQTSDAPVGMAIGSFSSVSLDPALVGFFPDRSSTSWPRIEQTGSFCVNVLGDDQEDLCRRFASKEPDKFSGIGWRPTSSGSPLLDGVLAWIDCDIVEVGDAGDHFWVLGRVRELQVGREGQPLVFFRGGYHRLTA